MSQMNADRWIGKRIRMAREAFPAMNPELVASYLQISVQEFAELEAGHVRPSPDQIMLLADLMDVSPSWFFAGHSAALKVPAQR